MKIDFHWHNYRYLPYEKALAEQELEVLFSQKPCQKHTYLELEAEGDWETIAQRTTYFRKVSTETGKYVIPTQALLEASSNGGILETSDGLLEPPFLKRQSTRYSAHGIHEYRGKFNPQIVRTIGNLLNLNRGKWVLDPFSGSGTTLLEAAHNGWNAIGVEINPLGVEIAKAKIASTQIPISTLVENHRRIIEQLEKKISGISFDKVLTKSEIRKISGIDGIGSLPNVSYLCNWFKESVLVQISAIIKQINKLEDEDSKLIFRVILSDILRGVSLQDPGDLRIRRMKDPKDNEPAISTFIKAATKQVETILKARKYLSSSKAKQMAVFGDSRLCANEVGKAFPNQRFDAAITSPPYVTALPYIDTQRLSLAVLGLINSNEIYERERSLIGSREITNQKRKKIEQSIDENADQLPKECISLIRSMKTALDPIKDGFRKQNMPALTYQYCRDMRMMFSDVYQLLELKSCFVLIVGVNKTHLGEKEFIINTPELLAALAEQVGYITQEAIELDTYHRYDIHQANSIKSETMLVLRK